MPGGKNFEYQILWVDFSSEFWEIMIPFHPQPGEASWSTSLRPGGFCSPSPMA
jgi:hypothetical protein